MYTRWKAAEVVVAVAVALAGAMSLAFDWNRQRRGQWHWISPKSCRRFVSVICSGIGIGTGGGCSIVHWEWLSDSGIGRVVGSGIRGEACAEVVEMAMEVVVVGVLNGIRSSSCSGVGRDRGRSSQVFALAPEVAVPVALSLVMAELMVVAFEEVKA